MSMDPVPRTIVDPDHEDEHHDDPELGEVTERLRHEVGIPSDRRRGSTSQSVIASLSSLPVELLWIIYETLPDVKSAESMARANKSLYEAWELGRDQIVVSMLGRTIPAWKEACTFAVFQRLRFLSTDCMKGLRASRFRRYILRNARLCARVGEAYRVMCQTMYYGSYGRQHGADISNKRTLPWDSEHAARLFYNTWLVASAFDERSRRQAARQYLRSIATDELQDMVDYTTWLHYHFYDQDLRERLDLGTGPFGATNAGLDYPETYLATPKKWCFALETIAVVKHKLDHPSIKIGPDPDFWSNLCGQGYQADWC